jgi:hypothetical protein
MRRDDPMTTEVLNEAETAAAVEARGMLEPVLPFALVVMLWAIVSLMMADDAYPFLDGYADGAFTIMAVSAAARIAKHFRGRGGTELADATRAMRLSLAWSAAVFGVLAIVLAVHLLR